MGLKNQLKSSSYHHQTLLEQLAILIFGLIDGLSTCAENHQSQPPSDGHLLIVMMIMLIFLMTTLMMVMVVMLRMMTIIMMMDQPC